MVSLLRAMKKSNATGDPHTDFELLPFGLYYKPSEAEKAEARIKEGTPSSAGQMELKFEQLVTSLDHLAHFGDDNYSFTYPEGVDETEFIDGAIVKAEAAVARLKQIRDQGKAIEA